MAVSKRALTAPGTKRTGATSAMTTAMELDTYAQWAWLSGRIGEAIDLYLDLARVYKQFPHVHFKLGYLFLTLQDYTNAVRHFSLEIERYLAATELDSSSNRTGQSEPTAVAAAASAVTPPPTMSPTKRGATAKSDAAQSKTFMFCACVGRSEAYASLKDNAKAEKDLLFVANRGGNTKHMLVAMGVLFSHFGMHLRAEECLDKCAKLDADDPDYLIAHAELRLAQKRYASAAKMFEHCRTTCSSSSVTYHRALIGEGAAQLRQNKLQEAVILLLQAMNNLRAGIRNWGGSAGVSASVGIGGTSVQIGSTHELLSELYLLYHQATNLYGGLCLLKGELKAALDTYCSVLQISTSSSSADSKAFTSSASPTHVAAEQFQLPTLCVMPGTRNHQGDLVDSTKLSTKNLGEALRHLDEVELRYGPDPCLYFHRASVHRALGEFESFVRDLSLVESMDPGFLTAYLKRDFFGDFLDLETISWLPLPFIEAIHDSLERHDHALPSSRGASAASLPTAMSMSPHSPRDRRASPKGRVGNDDSRTARKTAAHRRLPLVSDPAIFVYFQQRIRCGAVLDEYAHVHQLDVFRRLPEARRKPQLSSAAMQHLSPWEGIAFDERPSPTPESNSSDSSRSTGSVTPATEINPTRELIKSVLSKFGRNPCVHMVAGMVELELFNASVAHIYFTEAINLVTKHAEASQTAAAATGTVMLSSLARQWQQRVFDRVRLYCLIWRSMASRVKIEMERAVEDLNLAAAIKLDEQSSETVNDPLLLAQRTLIMLLNGHLKSAFKLLRQLTRDFKAMKHRRRDAGASRLPAHYSEWLHIIDLFANAGLNSFSLLPLRLEREGRNRLASPVPQSPRAGSNETANTSTLHGGGGANNGDDDAVVDGDDDDEQAAREEEETAAAIVRYALSKKTGATSTGRAVAGSNVLQTETLDKFYESGLVKLASSGSIVQTTPFFQAILSIDESYLPPTNCASLELLKCREADAVEEKLYACFVRLSKRSKWLHKKVRWRFEAFIDANLAHAYLPSDIDTLWHRARLLQDQHNYVSAINDLSSCLELMSAHIMWATSKKAAPPQQSAKLKAVFVNEAKRTQWLQLLLERGRLEMALANWERAIQDLTTVIEQVGKSNATIEASAYDARSTALIHLNRFGHAIQDLQHLVALAQTRQRSSATATATATVAAGHKSAAPSLTAGADDNHESEELLLHCILIGNLYCQLALDQMKVSAAVSHRNAALTPHVLEQLKAMHLNMGFITRADAAYADALRLAPDHFLVYYFRGRMLALSAQPKRAAECLSDCLRRHPMFLPALFLRGCIYAQQSLTILALADFYRVRHRAPTYPSLHTSIGFCHFDCGSLKKAVEALTKAVQQDASDIDALYMRGCALQELFVLESAVKDFTRVLALDAEHFRARYQRSVCYVLFQRHRDALADLDCALQLQAEWRDAWNLHAYACFCEGRYDNAVYSYGRAIGLRDASSSVEVRGFSTAQHDSQLFLHRALANMYANHVSAALLDLDLALKRDNENYLGFVAKAFLLLRVGEYDKALAVLTHVLPQYKKMRLMSPCDVVESERDKAQKKNHGLGERSASFIGNFFVSSSSSAISSNSNMAGGGPGTPSKASQAGESKHPPRISAAPDVIFAFRKLAREEQEQRAQAYRQWHHLGPATKDSNDANTASQSPRRTSGLIPFTPRRKTLIGASLTAVATTDPAATEQSSAALQRRARNAKFLRAVKKLTFEYRVLRALEGATSVKYKKNEQMNRVLADLLHTKSSVPWPKGTLTSNILVWAFTVLGHHHLRHRRVDDALMAFSLAIQAHPYNAVTLFNRGNVFLHIDALGSAVSGFQDAIEVDESCFQAYNNMGVALFQMKQLDDAHDAFATGLHHVDEGTHRAVLLYNLGVVFQHLDKPDEAIEFYQQAIALDASRTEFFNNRSSILHQQLKFTVALEDYNRALALGASDASVSALDSGGRDGNGDTVTIAASGNRSCIEARLNRAQLFITMGNCTAAIGDLRVVLETLTAARESESKPASSGGSGGSGSAAEPPAASKATSAAATANEALAEELLAFCVKWKDVMRLAVKDFLFAFDSFPPFAALELYSFFGPVLAAPRSADTAATLHDVDATFALPYPPLPIADPSFFDYERALRHWAFPPPADASLSDNQSDHEADDCEPDEVVRACKRQLVAQPFGAYLLEAMQQCEAREFEAAARCLLRAHYRTTLDSADEYVLTTWRVQVLLKAADERIKQQLPLATPHQLDAGLSRAVTLLQDFLAERQRPDEAHDGDDDNAAESIGHGASGSRSKKLRHNDDDGDDHEELSAQQLSWRQQRRVIRADVYTLLGRLHQLNGQAREARRVFACALRLRDDHIIALLNFLQLSIVEGEYETALNCVVRVFELVFAGDAGTRSSSGATGPQSHYGAAAERSTPRGLLSANRAIDVMLPGIAALRADDEWLQSGGQMLQLLSEYKHLLSAHIQSNTAHIFRKQGALAHLVEEIRQLKQRKLSAASAHSSDADASVSVAMLNLDEFNRVLDEYTASMLQSTADGTSDSLVDASNQNDELKVSLFAELAQVCDQVTRTLPPDALSPKQSTRPVPLGLDSEPMPLDAAQPHSSPRSPPRASNAPAKSPRPLSSAAGARKASLVTVVRRPSTALLSTRTHRRSTTSNSTQSSLASVTAAIESASATSASSQRASSPKSARETSSSRPQLQPQRPHVLPTAARAKSALPSRGSSRV